MRTKCFSWQASVFVLFISLVFALSSNAYSSNIIESNFHGATGFSYENLLFGSDYITLDIVNTTNDNVKFSASIIFIDIMGREAAKAELLPQKILANSKLPCKSYFTAGSAESAKRCDAIIWRPQVIK
jgi:hypothetical protein